MGDPMKKVQIGQKLSIPAATFNAFIDAAVDYRRHTAHIGQESEPSFRQASIVLVRNDSSPNQNRLAVLGIDSPIIDPASNQNEFKTRVALSCVTPVENTHEGKFVVLAEPIAAGKIGRAYAAGVCPVFIVVPMSTFRRRTTTLRTSWPAWRDQATLPSVTVDRFPLSVHQAIMATAVPVC